MYRYSLYIMKQLAWSTLIVAFSLTSIIWLVQALRFVDFIVNRGVSILTFIHLTALMIPSLLFMVLPFAVFCATLFVYNKLVADSELVVLRSAGLSRLQLARPALYVAMGVMLLSYFIALYLLPVTYRQFKDMQVFLRDNYASLLLQEEVFNSPVDGLTVFVRSRESGGILRGILVHDNRDALRPVTMMAQEGKLIQTPQGPRFILQHGNRQEMRSGKMSLLRFDHYTLDVSFYTTKVKERERKPEEMFLPELLDYGASDSAKSHYLAEAHQRITWPLYIMALTLLALVFLLGGEFNRRGQVKRLAAGVLVAFFVLGGALGLLNLATKTPMLVAGMYSLVLGIIFGCLFVLNVDMRTPVRSRAPDLAGGA